MSNPVNKDPNVGKSWISSFNPFGTKKPDGAAYSRLTNLPEAEEVDQHEATTENTADHTTQSLENKMASGEKLIYSKEGFKAQSYLGSFCSLFSVFGKSKDSHLDTSSFEETMSELHGNEDLDNADFEPRSPNNEDFEPSISGLHDVKAESSASKRSVREIAWAYTGGAIGSALSACLGGIAKGAGSVMKSMYDCCTRSKSTEERHVPTLAEAQAGVKALEKELKNFVSEGNRVGKQLCELQGDTSDIIRTKLSTDFSEIQGDLLKIVDRLKVCMKDKGNANNDSFLVLLKHANQELSSSMKVFLQEMAEVKKRSVGSLFSNSDKLNTLSDILVNLKGKVLELTPEITRYERKDYKALFDRKIPSTKDAQPSDSSSVKTTKIGDAKFHKGYNVSEEDLTKGYKEALTNTQSALADFRSTFSAFNKKLDHTKEGSLTAGFGSASETRAERKDHTAIANQLASVGKKIDALEKTIDKLMSTEGFRRDPDGLFHVRECLNGLTKHMSRFNELVVNGFRNEKGNREVSENLTPLKTILEFMDKSVTDSTKILSNYAQKSYKVIPSQQKSPTDTIAGQVASKTMSPKVYKKEAQEANNKLYNPVRNPLNEGLFDEPIDWYTNTPSDTGTDNFYVDEIRSQKSGESVRSQESNGSRTSAEYLKDMEGLKSSHVQNRYIKDLEGLRHLPSEQTQKGLVQEKQELKQQQKKFNESVIKQATRGSNLSEQLMRSSEKISINLRNSLNIALEECLKNLGRLKVEGFTRENDHLLTATALSLTSIENSLSAITTTSSTANSISTEKREIIDAKKGQAKGSMEELHNVRTDVTQLEKTPKNFKDSVLHLTAALETKLKKIINTRYEQWTQSTDKDLDNAQIELANLKEKLEQEKNNPFNQF